MGIKWTTIIALVGLSLVTRSAAAEPYAFRDIPLGITLEDFRKLPHPDKTPNAQAVCEPAKLKSLAGTVSCSFYVVPVNRPPPNSNLAPLPTIPAIAPIVVGHTQAYVIFRFFADPNKGGAYCLFWVSVRTATERFSEFVQAYTEHFGKPTSVNNEPVQNKLGAKFDNHKVTWTNNESSIILEERSGNVDIMSGNYPFNSAKLLTY